MFEPYPDNVQKTIQTYQIDMGYEAFTEATRATFSKQYPQDFNGIEKLKVLDEDTCVDIMSKIDNDASELDDIPFRISLLEKIIQGEAEQRLYSYFQSEFVPIWMRFYKNMPAEPEQGYAFNWHCDGGPDVHLKFLVYLNPTSASGGNTEFLDSWSTEEFRYTGYVFCPLDKRLKDLTAISDEYGIAYEPFRFDIEAGEAVLFEPFNILHKGIWPTKDPRYLIQICLLPSGKQWKETCEEIGLPVWSNAWPNVR